MSNSSVQQIDRSLGLSIRLWEDLSKSMEGIKDVPAFMTLSDANWAQRDSVNGSVALYFDHTDISPDKKRLFISYDVTFPDTCELETHIAVFRINDFFMEKESEFRFKDLALGIEKEDGTTLYQYRDVRFMGNDHIAIAMANGYLRILSIKDNTIFLETKIAGLVETIACSDTFLAASLFPGVSEKLYFACGVKIYQIKTILNKKKLEPFMIIPGNSFSILPHNLRFDRRGTTLLCKGSKILNKGYTNYIETYHLKSEALTRVMEEDDEDSTHRISNFSDNNEYCRLSKQGFWVNNQYHQKIWQPELPQTLMENGIKNCKLSSDGTRIISCRRGVLCWFKRGTPKARCITDIGYVAWAHFLSGSLISVGTSHLSGYDIKVIDTSDFSIKWCLNTPGTMEWIHRHGFDVTADGNFLIAGMNGDVRMLKDNLMCTSTIHHDYGPISQVEADPFNHEDALLSDSGAIIMMESKTGKTRLKISKHNQKPMGPGSGYSCIRFAGDVDDQTDAVWCTPNRRNKDLLFYLNRLLGMEKYKPTLEYSDYIDCKLTPLYMTKLAHPVCDSLRIKSQGLVLLQNGSVIKIDPFAVPGSQCDLVAGKVFPTIIENIKSPRGFCRVSDSRIVVWTKDSLISYELSDTFCVIHVKTKEISGINKVKWDNFNKRLLVAFEGYIGFWSLNLIEMYRLYLLSKGGHLIHVPYPEDLKIDHNRHHPGYFWSNSNCLDLFEVRSLDRKLIKDQSKREQFISQYFNLFMVEMAIDCYDAFYKCHGANNSVISEISQQLLLEKI